MSVGRKLGIAAAVAVSLPAVMLALAAFGYILFSIGADEWYRRWFLGYGVKLVVLYALFVAGIVAAALLATGRTRRRAAAMAAVAGALAALVLEFEFWEDADSFLQRGLFAGPFVAWAVLAAALRRSPDASTPSP